uniref:Tc1-like transposase DDE domain-containing protein n=1 Tax=Homalodisca liturata TaxID=320908 RepID=A0A1B6JSG0_9HEMI
MQDGAPSHYLTDVQEFFNVPFPGQWIGHTAPTAWPPCSPDLTPLDCFFWGCIKDIVYVLPLPAILLKLRARMYTATERVTPAMLVQVLEEINYRWDVCRITNGSHIEHF